MKILTGIFGLLLLIGPAFLRGESYYPHEEYIHHREPPPPSSVGSYGPEAENSERGWRSRGRHGDTHFQQFRREVRVLGEEIRQNSRQIQELEANLSSLAPGSEVEKVESQLNGLRRRQAELRLELARKKVTFSLRALENSEERYRKSSEELEQVEEIIERDFPDLIPIK